VFGPKGNLLARHNRLLHRSADAHGPNAMISRTPCNAPLFKKFKRRLSGAGSRIFGGKSVWRLRQRLDCTNDFLEGAPTIRVSIVRNGAQVRLNTHLDRSNSVVGLKLHCGSQHSERVRQGQ
jgi:hypothetical protein